MSPTPPTGPESAASALRRGTDDPDVFLIPEAELPPGFAEKVERGGFEPVAPRPAATVLLARDTAGGPEALLLRRHGRSGFAAGAWVFPGGVVDAADRDPAVAAGLAGPPAQTWAARLGTEPEEAMGYVAAALREAFEETGILLGDRGDGTVPDPEAAEVARRALLAGTADLRDVTAMLNVRLDAGALAYLAHWVTPEPEPRRYDTRFFLARVPADAACVPHEAELVDAAWLSPAEAVRRFEAGELPLLPPTIHTLRRLLPFLSVAGMLHALAGAPVPRILPAMRRRPDGVAIVLPGS